MAAILMTVVGRVNVCLCGKAMDEREDFRQRGKVGDLKARV